jgi:hypothetical protein
MINKIFFFTQITESYLTTLNINNKNLFLTLLVLIKHLIIISSSSCLTIL